MKNYSELTEEEKQRRNLELLRPELAEFKDNFPAEGKWILSFDEDELEGEERKYLISNHINDVTVNNENLLEIYDVEKIKRICLHYGYCGYIGFFICYIPSKRRHECSLDYYS